MKSDVTSKNRISKKREDMEEVKFLLYSYLEDDVNVGVIVKNDTLWLTQKSMAELFGVGVPAISKHLKKSMNLRNLKKIRLFPK